MTAEPCPCGHTREQHGSDPTWCLAVGCRCYRYGRETEDHRGA